MAARGNRKTNALMNKISTYKSTQSIKELFSIKRLFQFLVSLLVLNILVVVLFGLLSQPQPSDYIVILGNKVELNGQPSLRLKSRLDKGLHLYQTKMAPRIIVSGGIGKEGFDEAEVMADYLIRNGIPSEQIIRDNQGLTTFASAKNCSNIMRSEQSSSIIIVSQYFHLLRSKIAFSKNDIEKVSVASTSGFYEWRDLYSIAREIPGLYYYLIRTD